MSEAEATVSGSDLAPGDVRPVIATARASNAALWLFLAALLLGGWLVFSMLSARRADIVAPRTTPGGHSEAGMIASPPPLALPEGADMEYAERGYPSPATPQFAPAPVTVVRSVAPVRSGSYVVPAASALPPVPVRTIEPATVFETPRQLPTLPPSGGSDAQGSGSSARVEAGRLANPGFTVPQGTVIPAVLETALDSTRPGGVRALVQRDIFGFDGNRILVPRGSRLYGEYEADLEQGQKRAKIRWTRLLRPDGVTVALDSPASDPLGRAGIGGKVDSKFLQRFGGALLQSVLDIGVGLAANRATNGLIVALPGSSQAIQASNPSQIRPTLTVKQGTSVSVFVSRDLDFAAVGG